MSQICNCVFDLSDLERFRIYRINFNFMLCSQRFNGFSILGMYQWNMREIVHLICSVHEVSQCLQFFRRVPGSPLRQKRQKVYACSHAQLGICTETD